MQIAIIPGTKKYCSEIDVNAAAGLILGERRKAQDFEGIQDTTPTT
jgi:hypothetical protein